MSWFSNLFGGDDEETKVKQETVQKNVIDYTPEALGAQKDWWKKLQEWGNQPEYGAISPDWQNIWDLASKKINQYYWGGVGDTGLAGKVKASAARRNVSQSPALENQLAMLGMSESQQMGDLAKQEAINKASFGEQGRQNWLTSLQNLSKMVSGNTTTTKGETTQITPDNTLSNLIGTGTSSLLNIINPLEGMFNNLFSDTSDDWLKNLLNNQSPESNISSDLGKVNLYPQDGDTGFSGFDWNR